MINLITFTKKAIIFILSLGVMATGVSLMTLSDLGIAPVSTLPYAIYVVTPLSYGVTIAAINVGYLLVQIVILRSKFNPLQLTQVIAAFFFGLWVDIIHGFLSAHIHYVNYLTQWVMLLLGVLVISLGISISYASDLLTLPYSGMLPVVADAFRINIRRSQIICDVTLVVLGAALTFFVSGQVQGVREGTLVAMFLGGVILKWANGFILPLGKKILR